MGPISVAPMYRTLAVAGYRSLRDVVVPLGRITVVTGANGTGKSSLYRAFRLLAGCGLGDVIGSLAREGGLDSALWAGPESLAGARRGYEVQGTMRSGPVSLRLGFGADGYSYLVELGLPIPGRSAFEHDPEIKREAVWAGPVMRSGTLIARRKRALAEVRDDGPWAELPYRLATHASMLADVPELRALRDDLAGWRFYDALRVDADAPARRPQVGTRTGALASDGADLAAAWVTIEERGRIDLAALVDDAFPGSRCSIEVREGLFDIAWLQPGMLRPLRAAELSDGTLRYLLLIAALCAAQAPPLLVLNEPETSLHPSLVPALGRLIRQASEQTQVVVVTHSAELAKSIQAQTSEDDLSQVELLKDLGETLVADQGLLTRPTWEWGRR